MMEEYKKYDELKERIDNFRLAELGIDSKIRNNFYSLYDELQKIREVESVNGTLTDAQKGEKKGHMEDIDNWVRDFIEVRKKNVEDNIVKFDNEIERLLNELKKLKAMFALNNIVVEDVKQLVREIDSGFQELIDDANKLRHEFDELRELANGYTGGLDFTVTYADILKKLNNLRNEIKKIKKDQIAKYNANVKSTNAIIEKTKSEFDNKEGLSDDVRADLAKLETLNECTYSLDGKSYNNMVYMDYLDYEKLKQMLLLLNQIREKTPIPAPTEEVELEADMKSIEDKLLEIEGKIKDSMTMNEINSLLEGLTDVEDKITGFEIKLKSYREKISEEKYNEYVQRVEGARKKTEELRQKLYERIPNLYKALSIEVEDLNKDVGHLEFYVNALFGKITKDALSVYDERLTFYDGKLTKIKEKTEKAKDSGKLEDNQYSELMKKIEEIEKKLSGVREKVNDPKIVIEADIFALLNGQLDNLEKAVEKLEKQVDKLEKPIKDRETRKMIDGIIKKLEEEAKFIGKYLEENKEEDPEKYKAAKERLDNINKRLDQISKNYRKKCPFLVRAFKSAKDFYKKHKKLCLIVAGLAAIALLHATVGPVLIPAIMHGNIMIGAHAPALASFTDFVNNILGGLINAKNLNGFWYLANGVRLNNSPAGASLLKGLAISGIGSTALVAPVVVAVKKLVEKIKTMELKNKLKEKDDEGKKKVSEAKESNKEKKNEKKGRVKELVQRIKKQFSSNSNKDIDVLSKDIAQLVKLYRGSEQSLDDFCKNNGLTETDKNMIQSFIQKLDEKEKKKEKKKENKEITEENQEIEEENKKGRNK